MKKIKTLAPFLFISFLLALGWMIAGGKMYHYNYDFPVPAGINLFPLISWTLGLFAILLIYFRFEKLIKPSVFWKKFVLFVAIYWILLIFGETVGYYTFGVHNLPTASYEGLPIFKCLHAPFWMQTVYFLMGPIYFLLIRISRP